MLNVSLFISFLIGLAEFPDGSFLVNLGLRSFPTPRF